MRLTYSRGRCCCCRCCCRCGASAHRLRPGSVPGEVYGACVVPPSRHTSAHEHTRTHTRGHTTKGPLCEPDRRDAIILLAVYYGPVPGIVITLPARGPLSLSLTLSPARLYTAAAAFVKATVAAIHTRTHTHTSDSGKRSPESGRCSQRRSHRVDPESSEDSITCAATPTLQSHLRPPLPVEHSSPRGIYILGYIPFAHRRPDYRTAQLSRCR